MYFNKTLSIKRQQHNKDTNEGAQQEMKKNLLQDQAFG